MGVQGSAGWSICGSSFAKDSCLARTQSYPNPDALSLSTDATPTCRGWGEERGREGGFRDWNRMCRRVWEKGEEEEEGHPCGYGRRGRRRGCTRAVASTMQGVTRGVEGYGDLIFLDGDFDADDSLALIFLLPVKRKK